MGKLLLLVAINSLMWLLWSVIVGFTLNKIPNRFFEAERLKVKADSYRRYEFLKIKKWKSLVPEAGALFKGGVSKRNLNSIDEKALKSLIVESQRAEIVHWLIFFLTPVFFFFNPAILIIAMTLYGVLANIPFIAIQRYNRSRCYKALSAA